MSKIVLNPNSIYTNSQANFIVNRDAMYAFVRSVSCLNDSIYGIQPTREQLISGITLDDLQPLSANHSLCANVYFLNSNVDALKFFATKPFVVCNGGIAERDAVARNPLAVYLTPVTVSADVQPHYSNDAISANNYYEWIYTLPAYLSTWEEINAIYLSAETDENFRLSDIADGKWELIGSTSLTDEKVSALFTDVYDTLATISGTVLSGLSEEISAREALQLSVSDISTVVDTVSTEISNALTTFVESVEVSAHNLCVAIENIDVTEELSTLSTTLTGMIDSVSSDLCGEISSVSEALNDFADLVTDRLSNEINPKLSTIAECVSAEVERVDDISARIDTMGSFYLPLTGGTITGDLAIEDGTLKVKDIVVDNEANDKSGISLSSNSHEVFFGYNATEINPNYRNASVLINGQSDANNVNPVSIKGEILSGRIGAVAINGQIDETRWNELYGISSIAINGKIGKNASGIAINGAILSSPDDGLTEYSGLAIGSTLSGIHSLIINGSGHGSGVQEICLRGNKSIAVGVEEMYVIGNDSIGIGDGIIVEGNNSIGIGASVSADNAIQLGAPNTNHYFHNTEPNTFNVFQYKMLDKDGFIPDERISSNIVRSNQITNFVTNDEYQSGINSKLDLSGGTMSGLIYSGTDAGLGKNNAKIAGEWIDPEIGDLCYGYLCVTFYIHGDEKYLKDHAVSGSTISVTIIDPAAFMLSGWPEKAIPEDISVAGGWGAGTYELSFVYDPTYADWSGEGSELSGYVWEYALSDETHNYSLVISKTTYPSNADDYKYFSFDVNNYTTGREGRFYSESFYGDEILSVEHSLIPYGEVSYLTTKEYVDRNFLRTDKLINQTGYISSDAVFTNTAFINGNRIADGTITPTQLDRAYALSATVADAYKVEVIKEATPETSAYAATYHVEQGGIQVGAKINIPKDYLVKSAELCTVTEAGVPYPEAQIGDKYIDFIVNTADNDDPQHIYLPVNDLVDVYTGATTEDATVTIGIDNSISVTVNDSKFATNEELTVYAQLSDIPTDLSTFTNSPGYLTEHQSLSGYLPLSGGTVTGPLNVQHILRTSNLNAPGIEAFEDIVKIRADYLSVKNDLNVKQSIVFGDNSTLSSAADLATTTYVDGELADYLKTDELKNQIGYISSDSVFTRYSIINGNRIITNSLQGNRIQNGTVTPGKLDRAYAELSTVTTLRTDVNDLSTYLTDELSNEINPRISAITDSLSQLINDVEYAKSLSVEARNIDYLQTTPEGSLSSNVTIRDIGLKLNEILRLLKNDPEPTPSEGDIIEIESDHSSSLDPSLPIVDGGELDV